MSAPTPTHDVLVLQHTLEDHPAHLGRWLDAHGADWRVFCTEAGQAYPASVAPYRALAVLGGEWSANDERPSLRQAEALIREADALGVPVLGHCLGGQLMARAFGGRVARLPQPEVGWWPIAVRDTPAARGWFGEHRRPTVYQWHYDGVVDLPAGAEPLASSPACAHQAFALGMHLAMQFHVEITPDKLADWLAAPGTVYPDAVTRHPGSVQPPEAMRAATAHHQPGSEALAHTLYSAWRARWRA